MSDSNFDTLRFFAEDERIRDQLLLACRAVLRRPDLPPGQIAAIGGFIWLLQQLPSSHAEPSGRLALVTKTSETEWSSFDLCIDGECLKLETLASFDSGHGSDHESRLWLQVSATWREQPVEDDSIDEWLSSFLQCADDPDVEVSIDYFAPKDGDLLDVPTPAFNWATLESQYE